MTAASTTTYGLDANVVWKVVSASFSICDFTLSAKVRWLEKGTTIYVHTGWIIKFICPHSMPKLPILPHSITGCKHSYYSTQAGELRKRAHEISRISYTIRDHRAHTKQNIMIIFTGTSHLTRDAAPGTIRSGLQKKRLRNIRLSGNSIYQLQL